MAASDHLSAALFHATVHPFEPGDVVNPTDTAHSENAMAYATTDRDVAHSLSRAVARRHNRRNPDDQREGLVYEVEHMSGPADVWDVPRSLKAVMDPEGFRVRRRIED